MMIIIEFSRIGHLINSLNYNMLFFFAKRKNLKFYKKANYFSPIFNNSLAKQKIFKFF